MSQPPDYVRQFNFSNFSTTNPQDQQPGTQLDNEYNAIRTTLIAVLANLALIQRDDGALGNASVGNDQLKDEVIIGLNPAGNWLTATVYAVNDIVFQSNKMYKCLVAHTSGVFATDLAAVKWEEMLDFAQFLTAAANSAAAADASADAALVSETNAAASAASLIGTSTTSLAIAVASKTFTTQSGKAFSAGRWVLCTSDADPTNYMHGQVTSYSGTTLIVNVTNIGGSGTLADWTISLSGTRGAVGATGAPGAGTGDLLAVNNLSDVANAATSRTNLGVAIGSNVQAYDPFLLSIAALGTAADKLIYTTGVDTAAEAAITAAGRAILDDADAAAQRTTLGAAALGVAQTFSGAQRATSSALTSTAASIAVDLALNNDFTHTFTENTTLANPTNVVEGQSGAIRFTQHASSPKTLAFGTNWKFPGGVDPSVTATNSAADTLYYYVRSSTFIEANLMKGFA